MALTVKKIQNAKPHEEQYRLHDEHNLLIIVDPSGGKWWRFRFKLNGKDDWMSLGVFPDVTLKKAREARDAARNLVSQGINPKTAKKAKKLTNLVEGEDSFKKIADEFLSKKGDAGSTVRETNLRFLKYVYPLIGSLPIAQITPPQVLAVVQPIDNLGKNETAHRVLTSCGQVFRYGIATAHVGRLSGNYRGVCCSEVGTAGFHSSRGAA